MTLQWRITAGYTLLLGAVIAAIGVVIVLRFESILYDQAKARVDSTMAEIVAFTKPQFFVGAPGDALETLINSENVARWESPTTAVQVDAPDGAVLQKSTNLGSASFPPDGTLDAANPGPHYRSVPLPSGPFLDETRFLWFGPRTAAVVHVGEPLDALQRTFVQTRQAIVLILLAAFAAVFVLSLLLARQITGPINQLAARMRSTRSDRLEPRVERTRKDEIGQLATSFNDLLLRLGEAFARERQFIADASHELKTPLTSINANAQMLLRWGDRNENVRRESLETIIGESGTLADVVGGMLTLAKADRGDDIPKEPVSLTSVAAEAARSAEPRAHRKHIELRFKGGNDVRVLGDERLLRQLASNLIDNAVKFTEQGFVEVRTGRDARDAWLDVRDTGPGIPEAELPLIFDRFYRADKSRSRTVPGTGLGLAIVRSIARVHGGEVTAATAPDGGMLFRACFPPLDEPLTESS